VEGDDDSDELDVEGDISTDPQALAMSSFNESLSDSINLFQAIHVLQSKDDELALKKNESTSGKLIFVAFVVVVVAFVVVVGGGGGGGVVVACQTASTCSKPFTCCRARTMSWR
jgi:hypothetical protein